MVKTKQREIAHGCDMTVVADSEPFIHKGDTINTALTVMYPNGSGSPRRFDLIAIPDLRGLHLDRPAINAPAGLELLVNDINLSIGLHGAESLLVLAHRGGHTQLVRALNRHPELANRLAHVRGFTARPLLVPSSRTVIVGCIDYRLHGPGGFIRQVTDACGLSPDTHLMTLPGAAKEINGDSGARQALVVRQLLSLTARGVRRIVLVQHTDCGKYGGHKAFRDVAHERDCLVADLARAKSHLVSYLPKDVRVVKAIAETSGLATGKVEVID